MKKLFIIRHLRCLYLTLKFNIWWENVGRHFWSIPNQQDLDYLDDVWKGNA